MTENAHEHIKRLRREKFGLDEDGTKLSNPLEQDLRQALKHLAEELYATKHHFILELIQNAEDSAYQEGDSPMLSLRLLKEDPIQTPGADGCLLLLNNEIGFQAEQIQSLCSVGQSTKTKREGYIGEKGIGFKSVFQVTKNPHVFSNGYRFCFRKPEDEGDLGYIVPHWIEKLPPVVQETNARTAILLPLVPSERETIANQLLTIAPETILFLTKLSALRIEADAKTRSVIREGREGFVSLHAGESETRYYVVKGRCLLPRDLHEDKRLGVDQRELTIALPLSDSIPCTGRIFAFLPTECDSGLPFLVNSDFLLTASREAILPERAWNRWLRDCIAPVFQATFKLLLQNELERDGAYRFIPIEGDLRPTMAGFFKPTVDSIHAALREQDCVWTESRAFVRPEKACFISKAARALFLATDIPPGMVGFNFVAPELVRWRVRLRLLGVHDFTVPNLLAVINDRDWLQRREETWWEEFLQLLADQNVNAAIVAQIPLVRCSDGVCRTPNPSQVFLNGETPVLPLEGGPNVHLFAPSLQERLQKKPAVLAWLENTLQLRPLSMRAYIMSRLLPWLQAQAGDGAGARIMAATKFILENGNSLDQACRETLKAQMPWVLADGRIISRETSAGKEIVTPEALEGPHGWNWVFVGPGDREHFLVLTNDYLGKVTEVGREAWRKFFGDIGPTRVPDPAKRELSPGQPLYAQAWSRCVSELHHQPILRDWASPRWFRDFVSIEDTQNGLQKVAGLEQWLQRFPPDCFSTFLRMSKKEAYWPNWDPLRSWSELGSALRTKPWINTSLGYRSPRESYLETAELREFLGDSVAYTKTNVPHELLEIMGVRVRLTADVLIDLLRQMKKYGKLNFDLIIRIYRRLQLMQFDSTVFKTEALVYLSDPAPDRWRVTGELVWKDTGPVFDEHFGYLELTYGKHDLHGFFTQQLHVPEEPEIEQFAQVWAKLSQSETPERDSVEKRLRHVFDRILPIQNELPNLPWWPVVKQILQVWTIEGKFMNPCSVYVPDDGFAAEVFAKHVAIAWNPMQAQHFVPFLKTFGCRSLGSAMQAGLVAQSSESTVSDPAILTPASKELVVCMVCCAPKWRDRQAFLEAFLATKEVLMSDVVVEYSLSDKLGMSPVRQEREAFWQFDLRRLVLKKGAEIDAWRSAAADSIAVTLASGVRRGEIADTIYRLLTASMESGRRICREKNWSLSREQDEWLAQVGWRRVIVEEHAKETEQSRTRKPFHPSTGLPAATLAANRPEAPTSKATSETEKPKSSADEPPIAQQAIPLRLPNAPVRFVAREAEGGGTEIEPNQGSGQASSPSNNDLTQPRPEGAGRETAERPAGTTPIRLKVRGAEKAEVRRAQERQARRRQERRTAEKSQHERDTDEERRPSGLESLSQLEKATLEKRGREEATDALREMGYEVTPMDVRSPGYDLLAKKIADTLKVEVKAHLRRASKVFLPKGEWKEYLGAKRGEGARWELWNVEFLSEDAGHQVRITRYTEIPLDAIEESGFWVDLNRCACLQS